jgi:RNA polymerase sigma-70 factor (ECF subfamily)
MTSFPNAYLRFVGPVRAKCRRLLGNCQDAEDVASETFLRFWQSGLTGMDDMSPQAVMAWLYRTSSRLAIDLLRRRHPVESILDMDALPCGVAMDDALAARRLVQSLRAEIPSDELSAVVLCRIDGLSQLEAAEVLRISERTVRRMLYRFDAYAQRWREELCS